MNDWVETWNDYVAGVVRDPLVLGLIACLPPDGAYWPEKQRKLWLDLAEAFFALRYTDKPQLELPSISFYAMDGGRMACESRWRPSTASGADFRRRYRRVIVDLNLDEALTAFAPKGEQR